MDCADDFAGAAGDRAETMRSQKDVRKDWMRALETTARATRDPLRTLPRAVEHWADVYKESPALLGDDESYSFAALARRIRQYARFGLERGLSKGDAVALISANRPEYAAVWLGLTRIGVVVALVSPDLRGAALAHALAVSGARLTIASPECAEALREIEGGGDISLLDAQFFNALAALPTAALTGSEDASVSLDDRALRIFTSGTTGLPKAAEVTHRKLIAWTHWFAGLAALGPEDRLYNCLPMHHSVGGVVAVGAPLVNGGSTVIARKFSASGFWPDLARWDCTAFQYIGELCRYLLAAPEAEVAPRLRLALGNGLAAPVWRALAERFPQLRVLEFYASTEGNVWLYNVEGRIGALGRLPPYLAARAPLALVRRDDSLEAPWRGPDGFCVECADNEAGEALGRIAGDAASRFDGYSDAGETEKKVLRDVFALGDAWMRTGDLMRRDADGFYSFVDRIGETFRWKGENVATDQVAATLRALPNVADALVYGVRVAGNEGRAGMAALVLRGAFDPAALARGVASLPRWARPVFVRLAPQLTRTETFKPKRALYAAEGFNPRRIDDPLFWLDGDAYQPLDAETCARIEDGRLRL